jgi:PBSX family phage terminase large subunit
VSAFASEFDPVLAAQRQKEQHEKAVERLVKTAYNAGSPSDQIVNFLSYNYFPQPQQWLFHAAARKADEAGAPSHIALGGNRGGAKSHAIMCQVALDDMIRYPGLDVLYLRLVQKAARRSLDQLRAKTFNDVPHIYNRQEGQVRYPNGSHMIVGHFKNEQDIDKHIGIEYDVIVVEEATQVSKAKLDMLYGSLRTGKPGWRPRAYHAANPGGRGHMEFREKYILPWRQMREKFTKFIEMDYRHNVFINPEYREYLERLQGTLARMWREGDWDVGAGTYYIYWNENIHVKKQFDVPYTWPVWMSMDYGWVHPTVVQWHTEDPGGVIYTIAEYVQNRTLIKTHAENIKKICVKLNRSLSDMDAIVAGHDVFRQTGSDPDGKTVADLFREEGIFLSAANIDRLNGAQELAQRLGKPTGEKKVPPTWFVTENCTELITCIPNMLSDEKRPDDVLKVDSDELGENGDDPYDCARYGLMQNQIGGTGSFAYSY